MQKSPILKLRAGMLHRFLLETIVTSNGGGQSLLHPILDRYETPDLAANETVLDPPI